MNKYFKFCNVVYLLLFCDNQATTDIAFHTDETFFASIFGNDLKIIYGIENIPH